MPAAMTFTVTIEAPDQDSLDAAYEELIDAAINISSSGNANVLVFAPEET